MRNIINISLPPNLTRQVEATVKEKDFASKSEFFRYLLREWMSGRLAQDLEIGRKEHHEGKAKKLSSMKNLW